MGLAAAQLGCLIAFFYANARADGAMDKSGIGDLPQWQHWTGIADAALRLLIGTWVLALIAVPWRSAAVTKHLVWLFAAVPAMFVLGFTGSLALL